VAKEALSADVQSVGDVERIRLEMEEANARRLQPHHIRAFFLAAFDHVGGQIREREPGRFELSRVPSDVRTRDRQIGVGMPVLARYERVCFDKAAITLDGAPPAELIAPGHPLLEAIIDVLTERYGSLLRQGTVLIDDADDGDTPRALLYLEHSIRDARTDAHGTARIVSRRFEFIDVDAAGSSHPAGQAPYLDLRPPSVDELATTNALLDADWLHADLEEIGVNTAIAEAVPEHLAKVRAHTTERVHKVRQAVQERLTREINHWDHRAIELREQAAAGKQPKMNPDRAQQRADALAERLRRRLAELDKEDQLSALPPVVVGGALVVPTGCLSSPAQPEPSSRPNRDRIDRLAVDAVLAAERALGRDAVEMPHHQVGYDVRSRTHDGHYVFIEVKGRHPGGEDVTIGRQQVLFGLNSGDAHRLALVRVHPDDRTELRYVRHAFDGLEPELHFAMTKVSFAWKRLWDMGGPPS
jgi:hypothetical protein